MTVIARDFIRRFSHYKRLAQAGKQVSVTDRTGHKFTFLADKPKALSGAGRRYYNGSLLSPDPVPDSEWKGMR
jgi:hypothetical protein